MYSYVIKDVLIILKLKLNQMTKSGVYIDDLLCSVIRAKSKNKKKKLKNKDYRV